MHSTTVKTEVMIFMEEGVEGILHLNKDGTVVGDEAETCKMQEHVCPDHYQSPPSVGALERLFEGTVRHADCALVALEFFQDLFVREATDSQLSQCFEAVLFSTFE